MPRHSSADEVAATLAKAVRVGVLTEAEARQAQRAFARDWSDLARVPVTEALVARAGALAWDHGLRGYDAVQLASALTYHEAVGSEILMATFEMPLWKAAQREGLTAWPADLDSL